MSLQPNGRTIYELILLDGMGTWRRRKRETRRYPNGRLAEVGINVSRIDAQAETLLVQSAQGSPRNPGALLQRALEQAALAQRQNVSAAGVQAALDNLPWIARPRLEYTGSILLYHDKAGDRMLVAPALTPFRLYHDRILPASVIRYNNRGSMDLARTTRSSFRAPQRICLLMLS